MVANGHSTAECKQGRDPAPSDAPECVVTGPFSRVRLEQHVVGSFFYPSLHSHLWQSLALSHSFFSFYTEAVMKLGN